MGTQGVLLKTLNAPTHLSLFGGIFVTKIFSDWCYFSQILTSAGSLLRPLPRPTCLFLQAP